MADERREGAYGLQIGSLEAGRAWIGRPGEARVGEIDVNAAMIRQFVSAIRDPNPDYWREPPAVPPAMLTTWVTPQNWRPDRATGPAAALLVAVPMPGDSMINISSEFEFHEALRIGDRVQVVEEVESISDEKETRVGSGHFLTMLATYRRQTGELVALQRNVILRFWAQAGGADGSAGAPRDTGRAAGASARDGAGGAGEDRGPAPLGAARAPATFASRATAHRWSELAEGDALPEVDDVLDVERVVASAAATWTFFGGHIDADYARGVQGRDHVYLATGPVLGLLDAYVLGGLGRGAVLAKRSIRMDRSLCAGDPMRFRGQVVRRWLDEERGRPRRLVEIATTIAGSGGRICVRSSSVVELPE
ncbi:MAG: MaoC family dehydratase N-terminal domain-containing protein [Myxococcota bacterium]